MSIQNRPYAGTWVANRRNVVQWTPDFQVYVNGDTGLPGCPTCRHVIDLQEFINSISVDFGVEPGASNCSIGMSIPRHYGDSIFRDGNTLLRPGLEVHVYFRGYFPMKGMSTPNSRPVAGIDLRDIPQYPYYPVFHGVVTSVTHEYSSGFFTANMTCNGMLHFWEHMKLSGAGGGSYFGARPANSGIQTTLTGHPMTGKTPYGIIYSLYRDTAGAADGVGFALQSRTNLNAVNSTTRDPLYALTLRYWEQRFRGKIYGLRMHGASGQMFTSSQQAYLSLYGRSSTSFAGFRGTGSVSPSGGFPNDDIYAQDPVHLLGLNARTADGRISRQADTALLAAENEGRNSHSLDVSALQAFPTDIGSYGQVNLWESTYESKMDIATAVTNVCGYEFYQDADGDLVFKPPMYNLDTSSSRVYRIEPEDIVSINFSENEPAATYCLVKGGAHQNMRGVVDESEWGCRSQYIDYKLVAQFGWIETSVESTYYTNARSAFYFAINHLDRINAGTNGATVTIPMRPEIRPGYPVYIPHIDCFYYVTQVAHAFNLGSECTTTLTLTARRRKFLAPGSNANTNVALDQDLSAINLANTDGPVRPLQEIDNSGSPRLVGFPNVVMAIDPTHINPMFQSLGFQAVENELTRESRRGGDHTQSRARQRTFAIQLVQALVDMRRITPVNQPTTGPLQPPSNGGNTVTLNESQVYTVAGFPGAGANGLGVTLADIIRALGDYITTRRTIKDALALLHREEIQAQNELNRLLGRNAAAQRDVNGTGTTPVSEDVITRARETLRTRRERTAALRANFDAAPPDATREQLVSQYNTIASAINGDGTSANPGVQGDGRQRSRLHIAETGGRDAAQANNVILMSYLMGQYRVGGSNTGDTRTDPSGMINESANLLQMLSDRKASLSLTTPGYYRYYSASHPNPDMQGYLPVNLTESGGSESTAASAPVNIVRRSNREIDRAGGFLPMANQGAVDRVNTRMSLSQAAAYLVQAWNRVIREPPASREIIEILLAQWSHETGSGRSMMNNNFGGLKYGGGGFGTTYNTHEMRNGVRVATTDMFQAYTTPERGAAHYVQFVTDHRHVASVVQYLQRPGDAMAFAREMSRVGYFTSSPDVYGADLQGRLNGIRRAGVLNNLPSIAGPSDPASAPRAPRTSETATTTPASSYNTVVVRAAAIDSNIPEERRGSYVRIDPNHTPAKGLKVRVMEQQAPMVIPTNLIYSMTFEARGQVRSTPVSVPTHHAAPTGEMVSFINSCRNPRANDPFIRSLSSAFADRVGDAGLSAGRTTPEQVRALIALAVNGIENLRTSEGLIQGTPVAVATSPATGAPTQGEVESFLALTGTSTPAPRPASGGPEVPLVTPIYNITNGVPNDFDPSGTPSVRGSEVARSVLTAKARALVVDVTQANSTNLNRALAIYNRARPRNQRTLSAADAAEAQEYIAPWIESLTALFRGQPPGQRGIFVQRSDVRIVESSDHEEFSPVFPVSDERGFEHYGSFQYGRGLSIEPGGNYERLMASDPLRFLTDAQRERILRTLNQGGDAGRTAGTTAFNEAATALASSQEPEVQSWIQYMENEQPNGDRTTMIANGLRNYLMSNRDAVTKIPVNNAAYRLADLTPMGQPDTCACRGAESDLLLAAYMAGSSGMTQIVSTEEEAQDWVSSQMVQASVAWADTQSKMRGMAMEQGRRSLLDSVQGWGTVVNDFRSANRSQGAQGQAAGDRAGALGQNVETLFTSPTIPPRGQ